MKTEKELQEAAKWIWERKEKAEFWNFIVLTNINTDPSTLSLDRNKAFQIFTILEERRLILPIIIPSEKGNFPAYKINFDKEKEWKNLSTKKGIWRLYIWPSIKWFFHKWGLFIAWLITLILASSIQSFCNKVIEKFVEKLFK
jgi:hypothetical protein